MKYTGYTEMGASNSKRPWSLRTAPLSNVLTLGPPPPHPFTPLREVAAEAKDKTQGGGKPTMPSMILFSQAFQTLQTPRKCRYESLLRPVAAIMAPLHATNPWPNGKGNDHKRKRRPTCFILFRELVMRSVMLSYVRMAVVNSV